MRRIQFKSLTKNYRLDIINEHKNCIGEWLNGRATVSKTVGCVFESRLPCQEEVLLGLLFLCSFPRIEHATKSRRNDVLALRLHLTLRFANFHLLYFVISAALRFHESRLPCQEEVLLGLLFLCSFPQLKHATQSRRNDIPCACGCI